MVRIEPETDSLAWLELDPSTNPPQPMGAALLYNPEDDELWVNTYHSISGTPEAIWHHRILRWWLPANVDAVAVTEAINNGEIDALLTRIREGHVVEWDGSNHVGDMTEEAREAELELADEIANWGITYELRGENAGLWDAADWFAQAGYQQVADWHNITPDTSDDDLWTIAERIDAETRNEEQVILTGTARYLEWVRDYIREHTDDT